MRRRPTDTSPGRSRSTSPANPTVPRCNDIAASRASASRSRVTPNDRFVASVPAIDWNTRSTGAPSSMHRSVVVTWVSTHDCVGIAKRVITSSRISSRRRQCCGESSAGLMPMTASPHPNESPSTIEARIPSGSSAGWFGWRRTDSRPGRPIVERNAVTFEHLLATRTRSWLPMTLLTAATISGVRPHATAHEIVGRGVVGQQPLTELADGHRAHRRERLGVVLVVDQPADVVDLPRDDRLVEERRERAPRPGTAGRPPAPPATAPRSRRVRHRTVAVTPWPAGCAGRRRRTTCPPTSRRTVEPPRRRYRTVDGRLPPTVATELGASMVSANRPSIAFHDRRSAASS